MTNKSATIDERFDRLETQLSDFVVPVSKGFESTHKDVVDVQKIACKDSDDILGVLGVTTTRIHDRFTKSEDNNIQAPGKP